MLIEFSGADGSGKTTAMELFCARLEERGARVLKTREVGCPHIEFCATLRKILLDPNRSLDGRTMEFVFAAMRIENQKFYDSVRNDYDHIVSDRGWLCHLAYTDHNVSHDFTGQLYLNVVQQHTTLPQRIYLFDVDPSVARERRGIRGEAEDAIEAKGYEFQVNVVESYRMYARLFENFTDIRVIDANQGLSVVSQRMINEADTLPSY